jgi:hypothetical protein
MTEEEVVAILGPPDKITEYVRQKRRRKIVTKHYYYYAPERLQKNMTIIKFTYGRMIDEERIHLSHGEPKCNLNTYNKIEREMKEGEVLAILGPPAKEIEKCGKTRCTKHFYYYESTGGQRITTIIRSAYGVVYDKERIYGQEEPAESH